MSQSRACCTVPPIVAEGYKEKGEWITVNGMKTYATGPSDAKKAILVVVCSIVFFFSFFFSSFFFLFSLFFPFSGERERVLSSGKLHVLTHMFYSV